MLTRSIPVEEQRLIGLFLVAIVFLLLTGVASWALPRRISTPVGAGGSILGCVLGCASILPVLGGAGLTELRLPMQLPLATFHIGVDPLSALFLLPTFFVCALAAFYGAGYSTGEGAGAAAAHRNASWFWFNLLVASMVLVIASRNGMVFLIAWELMTIASYFLIVSHAERADVRRAGNLYLVAAHIGAAFLLVLFLLLGSHGSLDFDSFAGGWRSAATSNAIFLLAITGFGIKAGFIPLHVWLPEAHPAAPTHVSAVLSGIMIKLGIYGILRTLTFLGEPELWWGWVLVVIGLVSGILGVLYALAQHEIKRLLAYHSVENIGIIAMGMGLGLIGLSQGSAPLAALGFGAALLHVLNHALFKPLLFFGAGAVIRAAGTGEIEHLGGLLKRLPGTAAAFWIGAIAISGLPPLNGFVSEFILVLGSFAAVGAAKLPIGIAGVALIAGLALIGGLASACFAKAFGIVFLGEPRSARASQAAREEPRLLPPMAILAAACIAIGLAPQGLLPVLARALPSSATLDARALASSLGSAGPALLGVTWSAVAFLTLVVLLSVGRAFLLRRAIQPGVTWDCGYARPTARIQYTASSFAQPILALFAPMLGTKVSSVRPLGAFPRGASLETATPDSFRERVFRPIFAEIGRALGRFRGIQEGRVQVYVLYIALTLLVLLAYQFARNP